MKTCYYYPDVWSNETPNVEDAYEFKSDRDIHAVKGGYDEWEVEWLVEEMSKDFFDNHDGWELADAWAGQERIFAVWDDNKNFIGQFDVYLDYEPTFRASRKK
jgi:hypothetical protein